ncbi:MAG: cupin [Alteromonadaceae bacterium]|uniref:DSBH domain-containing protein n=2 Tax=Paraglaciecola mesophila TaxID=197222 RepID=K6ZA27_9ALTE|nr:MULTISPECIES: cupin [Paraglaciecola]ABG40568.1 DSBH domain containing protein [Paraglaciecola sp. T6c]MAD18348.1 cupin [Alteromonadaceae bacterium]MBB20712.1 cupin [Rickettsiales bacterium]GAC25798.1 DSBH domain-containing protein [Paraglaciecola mesophila KMM 241]|tara:strand:- start:722 stop:1033 length:312 start_codon:yes stop_codon:yes gene_type:complete
MEIIRSKKFTASLPWGSMKIANMNGITTKLHWANEPYRWHVNEGEEVFAVLDGMVEMQYMKDGVVHTSLLNQGDIFYANEGTEHVASPVGEARILVVETEGSI